MTAAGPNGLIVAPENEDAAPWGSLEGAGVVSSLADVGNATGGGNLIFAGAGAGLDALDALMNPLDALGSAGVGYLIEHLWFLHEPLDALAGDPTQITAQSRTWHNVAEELHALAADHRRDVAAIDGWEGSARDAYGVSAARYADRLDEAGDQAALLSELIHGTGLMVATERALVRDLIADFIWWLIQTVLASLIGSLFTAGAAAAIGLTLSVLRALDFAADLARRIATFLESITHASGAATALAARFRQVADRAEDAQPGIATRGMDTSSALRNTGTVARDGTREALRAADAVDLLQHSPVRPHAEVLTNSPMSEVAELGKQQTAGDDNRRQWEDQPVTTQPG